MDEYTQFSKKYIDEIDKYTQMFREVLFDLYSCDKEDLFKNNVRCKEDFDVKRFRQIIDQLGFELIKKEDLVSSDDFEPIAFGYHKDEF